VTIRSLTLDDLSKELYFFNYTSWYLDNMIVEWLPQSIVYYKRKFSYYE